MEVVVTKEEVPLLLTGLTKRWVEVVTITAVTKALHLEAAVVLKSGVEEANNRRDQSEHRMEVVITTLMTIFQR